MLQGQISTNRKVEVVANQIAMCRTKGSRSAAMSRTVMNGLKNLTGITNLSRLSQIDVKIYIDNLQEKVEYGELTTKTTGTYISFLNAIIEHTDKHIHRNNNDLHTVSAKDYGLSAGPQGPCLPPTSIAEYKQNQQLLDDRFKQSGDQRLIGLKCSDKLQRHLGLRNEESKMMRINNIKIKEVGRKSFLVIGKADGTKNGRPREIELTPSKMSVLNEVVTTLKDLGWACPTPPDSTIKQQIRFGYYIAEVFEKQFGLKVLNHGNRRAFACEKLSEIKAENPSLSDKEARLILSKELGHGRIDVTYRYVAKD